MGKYAAETGVSSEQSALEIERTLVRYGASAFLYGTQAGHAVTAFGMGGRRMRFVLPLPDRGAPQIVYTPVRHLRRTRAQQEAAYEQAMRQRWRALALVIKAQLEAVERGITTIEEAFLAHVVLPDGATVGQRLVGELAQIAATGQLPPLLLGPRAE